LTPGDVTVTVNGVEITAEVTPLADGRVRISGPGFSVTFGGTQGGSEIVLPQGGSLTFTGTGYQPGSRIEVVLATTNQSIGSGTVNDQGTFRTTLGLSSSVSEGDHMVQASGIGRDGASRVLQIGVRVSKISRSTVAEFAGYSAALTPELRARVKRMLDENATARAVQCRGFVKVSTPPTKDDIALANSRARNVCAYLKTLKPTLVTSTARGVGTTQLRRVTLAFSN
jgi:hypothetical protein